MSAEGNGSGDADDFYVFLYDEEDRANNQAQIKGQRSRG